jgi:hypothetical protein
MTVFFIMFITLEASSILLLVSLKSLSTWVMSFLRSCLLRQRGGQGEMVDEYAMQIHEAMMGEDSLS